MSSWVESSFLVFFCLVFIILVCNMGHEYPPDIEQGSLGINVELTDGVTPKFPYPLFTIAVVSLVSERSLFKLSHV